MGHLRIEPIEDIEKGSDHLAAFDIEVLHLIAAGRLSTLVIVGGIFRTTADVDEFFHHQHQQFEIELAGQLHHLVFASVEQQLQPVQHGHGIKLIPMPDIQVKKGGELLGGGPGDQFPHILPADLLDQQKQFLGRHFGHQSLTVVGFDQQGVLLASPRPADDLQPLAGGEGVEFLRRDTTWLTQQGQMPELFASGQFDIRHDQWLLQRFGTGRKGGSQSNAGDRPGSRGKAAAELILLVTSDQADKFGETGCP